MTFYSNVSIDAICVSSWHFYVLSVYHSSISSQFPNFPWNTLEGFAVSGLGRRSISQGQQAVVLVVQCTDWWGYVGSCPGLLLCINTWGCFLGSLSDFWAHKKILGDVQDFFSRVCQRDLGGINSFGFQWSCFKAHCFKLTWSIVQVSFICLLSLMWTICVFCCFFPLAF